MGFDRRGIWFELVVAVMIVSFTSVSLIVPAANAGEDLSEKFNEMEAPVEAPSDTVQNYDRDADMAVVNQALSRKKVQEKLEMIGYTVDGIQERLQRLSDEEIHRMAQRLEQVKAGGHLGLGELNIVIIILLIILAPILAVIWVVLMLLGHDVHLHE